jgi:DNA modification methylase
MFQNVVYNDDCLKGIRRYPDNNFDLAIVDVPYGIGESSKDFNSRNVLAKQKNGSYLNVKSNRYTQKDWDKEPPSKSIL